MNDRQRDATRSGRVPSYSLTVALFAALLVLSFMMAAITAGL